MPAVDSRETVHPPVTMSSPALVMAMPPTVPCSIFVSENTLTTPAEYFLMKPAASLKKMSPLLLTAECSSTGKGPSVRVASVLMNAPLAACNRNSPMGLLLTVTLEATTSVPSSLTLNTHALVGPLGSRVVGPLALNSVVTAPAASILRTMLLSCEYQALPDAA